jgi:hypothetical protein
MQLHDLGPSRYHGISETANGMGKISPSCLARAIVPAYPHHAKGVQIRHNAPQLPAAFFVTHQERQRGHVISGTPRLLPASRAAWTSLSP